MPNHDEYDPFAQDSELSQAIGGQAGGDEAFREYQGAYYDANVEDSSEARMEHLTNNRQSIDQRLIKAKNKLLAVAGQSVLESGLVTAEDRILAYQYLKAVNPDAVIPDFAKGEDTNIGEQTVVYDTTKNNGAPK